MHCNEGKGDVVDGDKEGYDDDGDGDDDDDVYDDGDKGFDDGDKGHDDGDGDGDDDACDDNGYDDGDDETRLITRCVGWVTTLSAEPYREFAHFFIEVFKKFCLKFFYLRFEIGLGHHSLS